MLQPGKKSQYVILHAYTIIIEFELLSTLLHIH